MATKISPDHQARLKALGIKAKNEEEARAEILEYIQGEGIDDMENEDMETLLSIRESFVEDAPAEADEDEDEEGGEDEEGSEDDENDALADEVEEEDADEESEGAEGDEFEEMDRSELKTFIKENGLDIKVLKSMSDDDLRDAIRALTGSSEDEEDEEEEKPAPKKAADKKQEAKQEPKKKEEKKEVKKTEKKATNKARAVRLDPKNNAEDRKAFAPLFKLFPESEYAYAWVASAGVTIKNKGNNSQRGMILIENCSKQTDGTIKCNLYLLTFVKSQEVLDNADIEYERCWNGTPLVKGLTLEEAIEMIEGLMDHIVNSVQKTDKKLGENRKKMEDNLKKNDSKKATKKPTPEPEEADDEDEEEEEPAPKKKPLIKPILKKKATKK